MSIPPEIMQQLQQQVQGINNRYRTPPYPSTGLVPTGNLPVPTGNLPVPLTPRPMGANAYGPMAALGTGGGWINPPGVPGNLPPSVTPVSIRSSIVPGAAPKPPNIAQLLQPNIAGTGTAATGATGNILQRALGKIPGGGIKIPGGTAGRIGLGIGLPMLGNIAGDAAGGDDSILGRFLKGAGAGGGAGILFGPQAALAGGLIGGVGNALFGGGKDDGGDFGEKLGQILDEGNFSPEDRTQISLMYSILKETQGEEVAKSTIGQIITQDLMMREEQQAQEQQAQAKMLATQALTAQFFQPFTQQLLDSAQQRYQLTESLADQLPPEVRNIARANNIAAFDNATRVANAYAAQAQLIPAMAGMQMQQGLANQLAQQQAQQVMANLFGGGGGGGSLNDLLSAQALGQ